MYMLLVLKERNDVKASLAKGLTRTIACNGRIFSLGENSSAFIPQCCKVIASHGASRVEGGSGLVRCVMMLARSGVVMCAAAGNRFGG